VIALKKKKVDDWTAVQVLRSLPTSPVIEALFPTRSFGQLPLRMYPLFTEDEPYSLTALAVVELYSCAEDFDLVQIPIISVLYVLPQYRRLGLGRNLFGFVLERYADAPRIELRNVSGRVKSIIADLPYDSQRLLVVLPSMGGVDFDHLSRDEERDYFQRCMNAPCNPATS